jgi:hypothetical protein
MQIDFGTISVEDWDKVNFFFSRPSARLVSKEKSKGYTGHGHSPARGQDWEKIGGVCTPSRVVESSRKRGFCSEGHPPGFYLEARRFVWSMDYVVE